MKVTNISFPLNRYNIKNTIKLKDISTKCMIKTLSNTTFITNKHYPPHKFTDYPESYIKVYRTYYPNRHIKRNLYLSIKRKSIIETYRRSIKQRTLKGIYKNVSKENIKF